MTDSTQNENHSEPPRTWTTTDGEMLEARWDNSDESHPEMAPFRTRRWRWTAVILATLCVLYCFVQPLVLRVQSACQQAIAVKLQKDTAPNGETRMARTVDGVEYAFRWCPPGTFKMGSPWLETGRNCYEYRHSVTLTMGFWMLETEVTQAMWQSVMGETIQQKDQQENREPCLHGEGPNYPMYYVSWDDCQVFCERLSDKIGMKISLPTEAQWEYACRAGTTTPFHFGCSLNGDKANCNGTRPYGTLRKGPQLGNTAPVRSYAPNAWGLYDMHGNVWEWCLDRLGDWGYSGCDETDPLNTTGWLRVHRGGSWLCSTEDCRSARQGGNSDDKRESDIGFRVITMDSSYRW